MLAAESRIAKGCVLLIEDDTELHNLIRIHANEMGLDLESTHSGEHGLALALEKNYDLIVVDWNLPKVSGLEICRRLRAKGVTTPILMLTARGDEVDRLLGFEAGADDYVCKPFSVRELSARLMALLRRSRVSYADTAREADEGHTLAFGALVLDKIKRQVSIADMPIELTAREFDLLAFLATYPGRPFTREQLLENVWHHNTLGYERVVTTYVGRVRVKLQLADPHTQYLQTVRGIGYKFADGIAE